MAQATVSNPITSQLFTLEDFYNYDDGLDNCYELVDGELIEMPTESPANCNVARRLFAQLLKLIPIEWLSYKEIMLEVSGRRAKVRIPDMMILGEECYAAIKDQRRGTITQDMPPPLVAIEIVSVGKVNEFRDYRYKRSSYILPRADAILASLSPLNQSAHTMMLQLCQFANRQIPQNTHLK